MTAFDVGDGKERGKAVEGTLGVSLKCLTDEEPQRFRELAVFPEDIDVPLGVLERFWGLRTREVRKLCKRFHDLSLLLRFERAAKTIRLHDVVRQYLIDEHRDLPALHRQLLERCRPQSGRWTDLEDGESYLWRHLAGHLTEAGDRTELRRLLFDLDYLEGKLRTVGVNALLADYDVLGETGEARKVQEALRLSAHVLSRDWDEFLGQVLAGQLLGRLGQVGEEGRRLLQGAADRTPLRPRRVRMSRTGGPLIRTLEGHTHGVHAVAMLDEKRVVSASRDHTLRVWDLDSGETIRTLEGHTSGVQAVAVLDDQRVVSASSDQTLRVWDVESGRRAFPARPPACTGRRRRRRRRGGGQRRSSTSSTSAPTDTSRCAARSSSRTRTRKPSVSSASKRTARRPSSPRKSRITERPLASSSRSSGRHASEAIRTLTGKPRSKAARVFHQVQGWKPSPPSSGAGVRPRR